MIFEVPVLGRPEHRAIEAIDGLHRHLRWMDVEPRRWFGGLRRLVFARAVQGSNSIEGYNPSFEGVVAVVDDEEPMDAARETSLALQGYRDAMTYVLQLVHDPELVISDALIRSLHFMMLKHDLAKRPGRWRGGAIYVRRDPGGEVVYEGPD